MQFPSFLDLGFGITRIDTGLVRPGLAACYLMEQNGRLAVLETGTAHTVPRILELIESRGYTPEAVDFIIVTHVHLDHAGGAGALMQACPGAQLVVHPRGARHMVDPAKLQAGAMAVYGKAAYEQLYGDLVPVPEQRLRIAEDGCTISLADRPLQFFDTPGHAKHHFCVYDAESRGLFTGDTLGIVYPELCAGEASFVIPTTTPVQFEPERLVQSIDRLMALEPRRFFLTHFGMVEASAQHVEDLKRHVDAYQRIALARRESENRLAAISADLLDYTLAELAASGCSLSENEQRGLLTGDMALNAQGLEVWLQQR